jgi:ABC-type transport system involved in Fe-S cluster assembly fused permease/ATPase subunit
MKTQKSSTANTIKILLSNLWPMNRPDLKIRLIVAIFFLIIAKITNVYVPFLLKMSIDEFTTSEKAMVLPTTIIFSYGLARISVAIFGELRDLVFVRVAQFTQRKIALESFQHLHSLSLDFHLSRQTGGISRTIERGTRAIQFVLTFMTFNILPTLFEITLVAIILSKQFGYLYAGIVVGTIGLYIALTLIVTEWRLKYRRKMNKSESDANTNAIDSLLNYETVKYFGNEEHEYKRYDNHLAKYENAAITSQGSLSLLNVVQSTIIGIGLISIMLLAGEGVIAKTMTVGDFVLVNTFLIQLYLPLNFLGFVYREIKNSLTDMEKMFDIIKQNPSVKDDIKAEDIICNNAEIHFKNVSFSYKEDRQILSNVDFVVKAGTTTAIVGPSGSGKSTIARLLFRFYDVSDGEVLIDGQDIRTVTQKSLRKLIGVVPQDNVLFNDSIGYNIAYGKPESSEKDIRKAAELAEIDQFIMTLPDAYETSVGERGLKLSGGEKQRVAIARTVLKNPSIFLFDEATSALDSQKEKEIQASLKKISKNRSTLIIAHRLSTITHADEILVLDGGQIIERGTHEHLLSLEKSYFKMWAHQLNK